MIESPLNALTCLVLSKHYKGMELYLDKHFLLLIYHQNFALIKELYWLIILTYQMRLLRVWQKKSKELFVGNIEGGVKNMMPDIFEIKGGMNELNQLAIIDSEEIEYLVDTGNALSKVGNLFSKLQFLDICNMKHLRALWHGSVPGNGNGSFEKLEKLELTNCPELTSLFMYVIAPSEYEVGHSVQSKIFQNLKKVNIGSCGKLNHVFSASIIRYLSQLIELKIRKCDMLEQIIGDVVDEKEERDRIIEESNHFKTTSIPSPTTVNAGIFFHLHLITIFNSHFYIYYFMVRELNKTR